MSLTQSEITFARSWIGQGESDLDFQARYDRYLVDNDEDTALGLAIEESMRTRLTIMSEAPASITLPGGISASFGQNMTTMMAAITSFRHSRRGVNGTISTSKIRRTSTR